MYPHERSLVKQLSDKPLVIIGVNSDSDLEEIRETVKEKNITWRSFWNGPEGTGGPISRRWNVTGWPTIYVIDAKGVIRYKDARGDELDEAITTLLAEMGHEVVLKHEEIDEEAEASDGAEDADSDADSEDGDADSDDGDDEGDGDGQRLSTFAQED